MGTRPYDYGLLDRTEDPIPRRMALFVYNCEKYSQAKGDLPMADDLRRLLDYIIDHPLSHVESVEAQLEASATRDVSADITANLAEQKARAGRLAPYFARGLRMARGAGGRLVVEDNTPEGSMIAEAFARYLVSPGLAT